MKGFHQVSYSSLNQAVIILSNQSSYNVIYFYYMFCLYVKMNFYLCSNLP